MEGSREILCRENGSIHVGHVMCAPQVWLMSRENGRVVRHAWEGCKREVGKLLLVVELQYPVVKNLAKLWRIE